MKPPFRADYTCTVEASVIAIVDLDQRGKSVTNDMENISNETGGDLSGWCGVRLERGVVEFYSINEMIPIRQKLSCRSSGVLPKQPQEPNTKPFWKWGAHLGSGVRSGHQRDTLPCTSTATAVRPVHAMMTTANLHPQQLQEYAGALRPSKRYNRTQAIGRIVADFSLTWSEAATALDACLRDGHCCKVGSFYIQITN